MRLARILTRPREVMRSILDQPRDRAAIPLVLGAAFISSLGDANVPATTKALETHSLALVIAASVGVIVVASLVTIALFYLFGWITMMIGRFFDGQGRARELRSAIAWGVAPVIWSLFYRIPAAFLADPGPARVRADGGAVVLDPGRFANGCGWAMLTGLVELVIVLACIWVSSNTIGEAHRFSTARGFATYMLAFISPLVVALAAILTIVF